MWTWILGLALMSLAVGGIAFLLWCMHAFVPLNENQRYDDRD